jgi:acetyl esterase/lipase
MRHICFRLFCLLSMLVLANACKKNDAVTANTYETTLNVKYGADPAQAMDIYLPTNRNASVTKGLLIIHGGGWNSMDKNDFNRYVDTMKRRMPDFAIFNLNYRLANGTSNLFPTQENDVKAAVEFINGKLIEYRISNKFAFLGGSAGAHLSLLQAYKNSATLKPKVIVDFFGPTDMKDLYENPGIPVIGPQTIAAVMGGTPAQLRALYESSSPINYVNTSSVPTIILHGGADLFVKPQQAERLRDKLLQSNVATQYVFYPTEGHGWEGANLYDSFNKIEAFVKAHIN